METSQNETKPSTRRVTKSQSIQDFSFIIQPQLINRSPPENLRRRNIIVQDRILVSGSLQAIQQKLKFQTTADQLHHKLELRPTMEILCQNNIYRVGSNEEIELEFKEKQETLERKLTNRPSLERIDTLYHIIPEELHDWSGQGETQFCVIDSSPLNFEKNASALSHKLENRPSFGQLMECNILSSVAPNLYSPQQAIKFQKTSIMLEHKLEHRPAHQELIDLNIIKSDADFNVSQHFLIQRTSSGFSSTAEMLEHQLEKRPQPSQLLSSNILKDIHVAPSLQATFQILEHKRINDSLNHKLESRPSLTLLQNQNIWKEDSLVASRVHSFKKHHRRNTLCFQISHRPSLSDPIVSHIMESSPSNANNQSLVY